MRRVVILLALIAPIDALAQQTEWRDPVGAKLHGYLQDRMRDATPGDMLPVYFVMGDKLPVERFYPRVLGMNKATRRATVVRELKEHMERTQRDLLRYLEAEAERDAVVIVSRNYLGNFIRVRLLPELIPFAAAFESVAEVWFDTTPPAEAVEDSAPALASPMASPGNGPLDTRSFEVWAKGITGAGVVWMNSDSGCRVSQSIPGDVHPGLAGRLWENPGEIFNNGIDDDLNGKIDDYFGWDFGGNDKTIDDGGGHGTQTAGVFIAVRHDNGDILGNCPDARIMTGKLAGEASQWDAIAYAIDMGAHGQTSSHSYKNNFNPPPNYMLHRDVGEKSLAAGFIRTNSTSNNGSQCTSPSSLVRRPFNISAPGCLPPPWLHPDQKLVGRTGGCMGIGAHYVGTSTQPSYTPCGPFAWHLDDVLAVNPSYPPANWDSVNDNDYPWRDGTLQALLKPDLTGPTGTITSSGSSGYSAFSGTSNATPSVSSCLALALSANFSLTPEDMSMAVQTTAVDEGVTGKDNSWGAGRVDAWELTKMARAIHRINGDVSHTVKVSIFQRWSIELDSIPNTMVLLLSGYTATHQVYGEFTLRILNPTISAIGFTDNAGNFRTSIPLPAFLPVKGILTQYAVLDPLFGPLTGSNAIRSVFGP